MMSEEAIELRRRFIIGVVIITIFFIPIVIFLVNKYTVNDSEIIKKVNHKEDIVILVTEEKCASCKETKKILKEKKVDYIEINRHRDKNYERVINKLNLLVSDITAPTLINVEEGKTTSFLTIRDFDELNTYVENYKLGD